MKLNHINLPVHDVNATRDFLTKYFGMVTMMDLGENFLAMLTDEGGMVLNLSHFDKAGSDEIVYHRDFHVGFFVDSNEEVDRVHARFVADGVSVERPAAAGRALRILPPGPRWIPGRGRLPAKILEDAPRLVSEALNPRISRITRSEQLLEEFQPSSRRYPSTIPCNILRDSESSAKSLQTAPVGRSNRRIPKTLRRTAREIPRPRVENSIR